MVKENLAPASKINSPDTCSLVGPLQEITRVIVSGGDVIPLYDDFIANLSQFVGIDRANICAVDLDAGLLNVQYTFGGVPPELELPRIFTLAGSQAEEVIRTGRPLVRNVAENCVEFPRDTLYHRVGIRSVVTLPLIHEGRVVGTWGVRSQREDAYGQRELELLATLAPELAASVEKVHKYQQLRERAGEMDLVDEVAHIITSTLDINEVYQRFAEEMKKLVDFDRLGINVIDQSAGTLTIKYLYGVSLRGRRGGDVLPLAGTTTERMLETGGVVVQRDMESSPEFPRDSDFARLGLRSAARVPLLNNGRIVGSMALHCRRVDAYGAREEAILARVARQIAPAVENALLYEKLQEHSSEMTLVDDVARVVTSTLDIDQVYEQFAAELKTLVDFDRMVINLLDEESGSYTLKYLHGQPRRARPVGSVMPLAGSQNEKVLQMGGTLIREHTGEAPEFLSDRDPINRKMCSSMMVLLISKGRPIGTLGLRSRKPGAYGVREQVILERLSNQIAPAVENAELYRIRKEAEEAERLRNRQIEALYNIARTLVQIGTFEEKCRAVLEEMRDSVDADGATLRVLSADGNNLEAVASIRSSELSYSSAPVVSICDGVSGKAFQQGEPVVANDYGVYPDGTTDARERGVRASVALPVKIGGETRGTVSVVSVNTGHFSTGRVKLLSAIGDGLGMLLENSRLAQDLQVSNRESKVVDEVTRITTSTLDIEEACKALTQALGQLVSWDQVSITLINDDEQSYLLQYSKEVQQEEQRGNWPHIGSSYGLKGTQTGYVAQTGQTLVKANIREAPHFTNDRNHWESGLRSSVAVPLISKGKVIGCLLLRSTALGTYGPREQEVLERLARQMAPALQNAKLFESAQLEKERATTALAQLKALLSGVNAAILLIGNDRRVLWANEYFGKYFGIPNVDDLMARQATNLEVRGYLRRALTEPDRWFAQVDEVYRNVEIRGSMGELEVSYPEYRVVQPFITPVFDETGECMGQLFVHHDITEQKRTEEQLLQSQRIESVGRLAGGIAHDFNNLLTAIMGYCQLSLWEAPPDSDLETHLEEVQKSAERAANLTNQLLAFSRRQVVEAKVISLNDLIMGLDRLLRRLIGENIEFITLPAINLAPVKVDPGQLEQVLMNLVINARDAMPDGGKLVVRTSNLSLDASRGASYSKVPPGDYVMLEVSDTGVGMNEAVKSHIFEPFFTTKSVGRGTGLGLATCYGIVSENGGYIVVNSEVGHGTSFQIFLPAAQESVYAMPEGKYRQDVVRGTETVLLAEDDPLVRSMVTTILSDSGYRVFSAANGDEALRLAHDARREKIHLLLTDVVMPQMGGMELAARIREISPETKVIFTSGYTEEPIFQQSEIDAGVEFLQKPYVPTALGLKVRSVLDQQVL